MLPKYLQVAIIRSSRFSFQVSEPEAIQETTKTRMSQPTLDVSDIPRTQGDRFSGHNPSWLGIQRLLRAITHVRALTTSEDLFPLQSGSGQIPAQMGDGDKPSR